MDGPWKVLSVKINPRCKTGLPRVDRIKGFLVWEENTVLYGKEGHLNQAGLLVSVWLYQSLTMNLGGMINSLIFNFLIHKVGMKNTYVTWHFGRLLEVLDKCHRMAHDKYLAVSFLIIGKNHLTILDLSGVCRYKISFFLLCPMQKLSLLKICFSSILHLGLAWLMEKTSGAKKSLAREATEKCLCCQDGQK